MAAQPSRRVVTALQRAVLALVLFVLAQAIPATAQADDAPVCHALPCPTTTVGNGSVDLSAGYVSAPDGAGVRRAARAPAEPVLFHWRLEPPCTEEDAATVSCDARSQRTCPQVDGRVIQFWLVQRQRL